MIGEGRHSPLCALFLSLSRTARSSKGLSHLEGQLKDLGVGAEAQVFAKELWLKFPSTKAAAPAASRPSTAVRLLCMK
jgi:hypothetical protein